MRLIDADALEEKIECPGEPLVYWADIESAPTVNAVVLPCKIGDEVWAVKNFNGVKHPKKGIVSEMFFRQDMKLVIVVSHVARGLWMETIFPTYEEAEAAFAERKEA